MVRSKGTETGWAALIAERMPNTATGRVGANRKLRGAGAIAVRPGVYALPDTPEGRAALATAARELARQRGSALACVLSWLDSSDDEKLRRRFSKEHQGRTQRIAKHIDRLERTLAGARLSASSRQTAHARLTRLRKHLDRAASKAPHLSAPTGAPDRARSEPLAAGAKDFQGRVWVTRRGVLVDRIASAWLIERFVDPRATFRFVSPEESPAPGELRFDMAGAEFTHEGDHCTFETLVSRFRPKDHALRQLAEIVHDLDLKDGKFGRGEAPGVALVIAGLAATEPDDAARLAQGRWLFDCLYRSLRPGPAPRLPKGVLP